MLDLWSQASRKIAPGVSRVISLEAAEARACACASRIPVTRLSDISRLDRLRLPVFCAVTPLARDLTTHLGKGLTRRAARVSAVMEAIERVSAESLSAEVVVASFNELQRIGEEVANPEDFELPSDTAYAPDKEFRWVAGVNIVSGRKILVLEDLAISPPSAGILRQPDTNGIAAGANHLEAIVHALTEIIERDAISQHLFRELFLEKEDGLPPIRRVDPKYTDPHTKKWLKRIGDCGMQTVIEDCTTDLAVPVFRVSIVDHNFPSPSGPAMRRFLGYGCDLVSQKAISRAVTEAVQSRLATIQGARDSFNTNPLPFTVTGLRAARLDLQPGLVTKLDQLRQSDSNDLRTDLDQLVAALVEVGLPQVIAVDLTHPDLSVAVVRVRVPGLSSFLIDRSRPGWRCLRYLL